MTAGDIDGTVQKASVAVIGLGERALPSRKRC